MIQYLAKVAIGTIGNPQKVVVYKLEDGYVYSKRSGVDWNIAMEYTDCFVDCSDTGEYKIGERVGRLPLCKYPYG